MTLRTGMKRLKLFLRCLKTVLGHQWEGRSTQDQLWTELFHQPPTKASLFIITLNFRVAIYGFFYRLHVFPGCDDFPLCFLYHLQDRSDKIFLFLPPTDKGSLDNKFSFDEAKWLPTKRNNWIITQNPFVPPKKQTKLFLFTENLCHGQTHFSGLKELVDVGEGARS